MSNFSDYVLRFEETGEEDSWEICDSPENALSVAEGELQCAYDRLCVDGICESDIRTVETYCGWEMWVSGGDYSLAIIREWDE